MSTMSMLQVEVHGLQRRVFYNHPTHVPLHHEAVTVAGHLMGLAIGCHGSNIKKARNVPGIAQILLKKGSCTFNIYGKNTEAVKLARQCLEFREDCLMVPSTIINDIVNSGNNLLQTLVAETGIVNVKISGNDRTYQRTEGSIPVVFTGRKENNMTAFTMLLNYIVLKQGVNQVDQSSCLAQGKFQQTNGLPHTTPGPHAGPVCGPRSCPMYCVPAPVPIHPCGDERDLPVPARAHGDDIGHDSISEHRMPESQSSSELKGSGSGPDSVLEGQGQLPLSDLRHALNNVASNMEDTDPEPVSQPGPKQNALELTGPRTDTVPLEDPPDEIIKGKKVRKQNRKGRNQKITSAGICQGWSRNGTVRTWFPEVD